MTTFGNYAVATPDRVALRTQYNSGLNRVDMNVQTKVQAEVTIGGSSGTRPILSDGSGRLGNDGTLSSSPVDIGDFLIYRGFLSDDDTAAVLAYLDQKWGL